MLSRRLQVLVTSVDADPAALTPAVARLIALVAAARAAGTLRPA
jgi:hypothetical protein